MHPLVQGLPFIASTAIYSKGRRLEERKGRGGPHGQEGCTHDQGVRQPGQGESQGPGRGGAGGGGDTEGRGAGSERSTQQQWG